MKNPTQIADRTAQYQAALDLKHPWRPAKRALLAIAVLLVTNYAMATVMWIPWQWIWIGGFPVLIRLPAPT